MSKSQSKLMGIIMTVLLLASMVYVGREAAAYVTGKNVDIGEKKWCVVIDAGHEGDEYRLKAQTHPPYHAVCVDNA